MKKNKIMSFLSTLTIQEKKQEYSNIMDVYLERLRSKSFNEDHRLVISNILQDKFPPIMVRNFEGFEEEFWEDIIEKTPLANMIFYWFVSGVPGSKYESFKKMQESLDIEEA
jgi:hypothetical protein